MKNLLGYLGITNLSVRYKLMLGFGLVTAIIIALTFINNYGNNAVQQKVTAADSVNRIVKRLQTARIQEKNYDARSKEEYVDKFNQALDEASHEAKSVKPLFQGTEHDVVMDQILQKISVYREKFLDFVELNKQSQKAMLTMRSEASDAVNLLSEMDQENTLDLSRGSEATKIQGQLALEILKTRINEKNFIITGDKSNIALTQKNLDKITRYFIPAKRFA